MSWIKKAHREFGIEPEIWHKPPQTDRDFPRSDEAHERRSRGEFLRAPSTTPPTYSPKQQEALDKALKFTKGASWTKTAAENEIALTEGEELLLQEFKSTPSIVSAVALARKVEERTKMNLQRVAVLLDSYQGLGQRTDDSFVAPVNEALASETK